MCWERKVIEPLVMRLVRSVVTLEDGDIVHMVKGDYAIFNMNQPNRHQAVERVHQVDLAMH